MDTEKQELAWRLHAIGAIKFGKFRLRLHESNPDAPLSPIYIDLRVPRSHPGVRRQIVEAYHGMMPPLRYNVIADVPTAATPYVAILADKLDLAMITPRELKTHGSGSNIDGTYTSGQDVLLIDDLITQADSKITAITVLEDAGLRVRNVLVLVDRQQGGKETLQEKGYTLHSVFMITELLEFYREVNLITEDEYNLTKEYLGLK